jgi:hypothetical protein
VAVQKLRDSAQDAAENSLYRNVPRHRAHVEAYDEVLDLIALADEGGTAQ